MLSTKNSVLLQWGSSKYTKSPLGTRLRRQKRCLIHKYKTDPAFQSRQKMYVAQRCKSNPESKRANDPEFRLRRIQFVRQHRITKLATNAPFHRNNKLKKVPGIKKIQTDCNPPPGNSPAPDQSCDGSIL